MAKTLFTMSEINYSNGIHNIIGKSCTGSFEGDLFRVRITHLDEYNKNDENHEGCIIVSDNKKGCYKINILFGNLPDITYQNYSPLHRSDCFNCSDYNIPHFVWAIVTGMIVVEL